MQIMLSNYWISPRISSGPVFCRQFFRGELLKYEVDKLTTILLAGIEEEKQNTLQFHYTSTFYKTTACALIAGDEDNCAKLLNMLLNDVETQIDVTATKNARLLFIMAHVQKQNITLLP